MLTLANIFNPEALIILLVIVLVLFGGSKIPELMKGMGTGMREFKKGMSQDPPAGVNDEDTERRIREEVEAEVRARHGKGDVH
jgi:sec-independent protein translocase protein TatA